MQTTPTGWTEARNGLYRMETKVSIAGVDYSETEIISVSTTSPLFSSSAPSIGCCVSKEIDLSFVPKGTIPRTAEIKVYTRPALSGVATDWLQKGVFYIDTRETSETTGVMTVHGFDSMLKTEQVYCGDGSGTWPRAMSTVVSDICSSIGVTLDSRTSINSGYECQLDTTLSMRTYLSYIAAAHGGNWVITDTGKLRLVPFVAGAIVADIGKQVQQLESAPAFQPITKVILWCTDEDAFIAGNDTGRAIEADCTWATQNMANTVLASLNGYVYQPYTATKGALPPEVEIGDAVTVNGITGQVAEVNTVFNSMCLSDFSAPADEEVDHEYHYTSTEKKLARQISKMSSEFRVKADSIESRVEDAEGAATEALQTANGFSQRISNAEGDIAEIEFSLDGVAYTSSLAEGTTVINGGCITTGTIDASKAKISNLTVTNANITSLDAGKLTVAGQSIGGTGSYLDNIYAAKGTITTLTSHGLTLDVNSADEGVAVLVTASGVKVGSNAIVPWSTIIAGGESTAVFG